MSGRQSGTIHKPIKNVPHDTEGHYPQRCLLVSLTRVRGSPPARGPALCALQLDPRIHPCPGYTTLTPDLLSAEETGGSLPDHWSLLNTRLGSGPALLFTEQFSSLISPEDPCAHSAEATAQKGTCLRSHSRTCKEQLSEPREGSKPGHRDRTVSSVGSH